ncbi:MAG: AMP-binding protein [Solirubrobacteraceae bacterium]|nr:AMP-binding protein [Solirubrobacteraceae bacterium]
MLVDAWLPRAASAHPRRAAVGSLTYEDLLVEARRVARALAARGARPGERIAIRLAPGERFAVALHAALLLGAVAVPIDHRLHAREAERQAAGAAAIVDEALIAAAGDVAEEREGTPRERHDLDSPAIVVHTSGSAGPPKAVELTYGNWLWSALGSAVALGLDDDERWLCCLPLSHVGGLSILLRSAIYGTSAIVHERFDTGRVLAALSDPAGPTIVSLVPTTLARLLDAGLREPPALRWALLGGAAIPPALLERAERAGVPIAPTYGMTEACSQVATFGRPLFCARVVLTADGEVLVAGPTVAPAVGPLLRTGDLGALDERGRLTITGRKADTIISGGENVAPQEVEAVLEAHPAVAEAAVHGRPDDEWGEAIVATVVLRGPGSVGEAVLRAWCAARLAPYKVPKAIAVAQALPRTASGKLRRAELRDVG